MYIKQMNIHFQEAIKKMLAVNHLKKDLHQRKNKVKVRHVLKVDQEVDLKLMEMPKVIKKVDHKKKKLREMRKKLAKVKVDLEVKRKVVVPQDQNLNQSQNQISHGQGVAPPKEYEFNINHPSNRFDL